jgi:acetyltransferase-like isoleucine patch superfamily enzyme
MKQITPAQIATFASLFTTVIVAGVGTTALVLGRAPLGDFRGVVLVAAGIVFIYLYAFVAYRLFLRWMPLQEGELAEGSRGEFAAQVNILFYLLLFNSLIRTHFLPVPLVRLVYLALGARLGPNTYSAGVLLDPPLTTFGRDCIIGHDACIYAHAIEGDRFALARVVAGDRVTIGATAVVMSDVHIGDDAIVSAGAVVLKGTRIGAGEVWGGVPARRLRAGPAASDIAASAAMAATR